MSRDYRLGVSSPYFLYLYVQKYKSVTSVGPGWPWARVPCTLCTPYCYATEYTLHNFSLFAIFLLNIIKIGVNLTKF